MSRPLVSAATTAVLLMGYTSAHAFSYDMLTLHSQTYLVHWQQPGVPRTGGTTSYAPGVGRLLVDEDWYFELDAGGTVAWILRAVHALGDPDLPDAKSWEELEAYLVRAHEGAVEEAKYIWGLYEVLGKTD